MRGRTIFQFMIELARLDTVETEKDPDGAGALTSGYDADFDEPVVYENSSGERTDARKEQATIYVPGQIESSFFESLMQLASGNVPDSKLAITFHYSDLARMGLLDTATGSPKIRINDRLVAIRERCTCKLVQEITTPPGLYVSQAMPSGWGIGGKLNLLVCTFEDREQGVRT